ncbi:GH16409 [Drosophila grimshawi]|uniref:2'-phosphotransferase n=2 Tax=Drosophila grimshawi TaxID=7222 RepID=B4IZE7_DROGR|nr:GH16409 [Drosophila grimshawi]
MDKTYSNVQLSKQLSWLLRHGAQKEGLTIQPDGFVSINEILKHSRFGSQYTREKLRQIVSTDAKQRYTLRSNPLTGAEEIRANQGHSLKAVQSEVCMERIGSISELPSAVVHGTYYSNWERIKIEGLKRMQRNHVHFALFNGDGDNRAVLSGFRSDCQVLIYLNVAKVLGDQLPMFRSSNNVILCAGIDGCIDKRYFERAIERRSKRPLSF